MNIKYKKSVSMTHPHLLKEWDWELNEKEGLDPYKLTYGSKKKANWKCRKNHKWKTTIYHRTAKKNPTNCPYCANQKVNEDNCLTKLKPELIKEWSSKNKIKPTEILPNSNKKIWWKCEKCKSEWIVSPNQRCIGYNCPYCNSKKVNKSNSFFHNTSKQLLKEWDFKKNKIKPKEITLNSGKKVWWKCKNGHNWKSFVYHRTHKKNPTNCPICNESKGEKEVDKILKQLNIRYKREYKFKNLKQKRFDFAIFKKYKHKPYAVIEYQGKQHYEPVTFGSTSKEKAKKKFNYL